MHKIVVWVLTGSFVALSSFSEAQVGGSSLFSKDMKTALQGGGKDEVTSAEFVTLTCPLDGREFQVGVTSNDIEIHNGTKQVVCPYDGTIFFPNLAKSEIPQKEKLALVSVQCPTDGREFKAEVDVENLLAGRSGASLRCPYDGTKFRLTVFRTPEGQKAVSDPGTTFTPPDGKSFRAFLESGSTQQLFSPFGGAPLSPQETAQVPSASGVLDLARTKPTTPFPLLSRIEEMFVKGVSPGISTDIRQFGYDIFPQYTKGVSPEGTVERSAVAEMPNISVTSDILRQFEGALGYSGRGQIFSGQQAGGGGLASVPVGPDYVIGPGDTLILNIWGSIQQSTSVTVDSDGKIILPKAGPVYVWGLTFAEVESLIRKTLEEHFSNFSISVSMGRLRTIRIFIFGEVNVPGTYHLSPQATALHALYAAYGPTKVGTLRRIKLLRSDKTEESIDLYEILIQGNNKQDLPLKTNDTLLVPPIGDVIGVAGNVKRPAIYETMGPVTLSQILEIAGGPSASGYLQRIQIERIKEHERKVIQDFEFVLLEDLQKKGASIPLQDGDLVTIFPITSQRHNFVSIVGSVERPGDYELKEGMRLRDLIEKAGGVLPGSYLERAELGRYQTDKSREILSMNLWKLLSGDDSLNLPLKEWDVITVYSRSQVVPSKFVEIQGAVHETGTYELTEGMRLSDLIFRAGGLVRSASLDKAELFRTGDGEPSQVIPLDLREILEGGGTEKDLYLSEGDRVFVRRATAEIQGGTVTLSGEFRYPGNYAIRRGETLSSVIRRAGGFTDQAFLKGAIFTRKALQDHQRERVEQFLEAEQTALLQEQASLGIGYDPSQKASRLGLLEHREKLLEKVAKSEFLGRMIVQLNDAESLAGTPADIPLEEGDSLTVPRSPSSVLVVGNVYNPVAVTYLEGKNADYYLRKVGGMTKGADQKRVYVIKANGEAVSQFARVKRVERGDTIVVPEEFKYRVPKGLFIKDTVNFLYQIAFGAIAIAAVN